MEKIFISYKRKDKKKVHHIKNKIEHITGADCWIDLEGIESDELFDTIIMEAINKAEIVLFMYSSAHRKIKDFSNDWTMRELNFARKKNKRIVFINLDGSPLTDRLELHFGLSQQVNARSEESMRALIMDIKKWLKIDENKSKPTSENESLSINKLSILENISSKILTHYKYLKTTIAVFKRKFQNLLSHSSKKCLDCIMVFLEGKKRQLAWGTICLCFVSVFILFQKTIFSAIKTLGWFATPSDSTKIDTIIVDNMFDKLASNMVFVKGGNFVMGATEEQKSKACWDEYPATEVSVHDFYLCKYEVTQSLWKHVMKVNYPNKANPSNSKGDEKPVENVTWDDCQLFINELNRQTGENYRLPTEEEWEYAARGGINSKRYVYSGGDTLDVLGWFNRNSENKTHIVGSKKPNELGIYDMSGNVSEWCSDKYRKYNTSSGSKDYNFRGGCWFSEDYRCRSAKRGGNKQGFMSAGVGLRIATNVIISNNKNGSTIGVK